MKYELIMWYMFILKHIPGMVGCWIRNALLPYTAGKGVTVWDDVHIDRPKGLRMGNYVSINRGSILHCGGGIVMGDNVLIGPRVIIYSQNHNYLGREPIRLQGYTLRSVHIGENTWCAAGVIILPGVKIGKNALIAAGTVVNKDVLDDTLAYGSPMKFKVLERVML